MLLIFTLCKYTFVDLRRWESGLRAKTKRITDKPSPWYIPLIILMTSDTIESSFPLRLNFVYHDSVKFLITKSKWFESFLGFSAWRRQLCGVESKAFLQFSQIVTRLHRSDLTSFRMHLLKSSCSTVPYIFSFPAACSGFTILFLYTWSIIHWLMKLLYNLYTTLRHAMGWYLLVICVSVFLGNKTMWANTHLFW